MMVVPSGLGKSSAWKVLLRTLEHHEGVEGKLRDNIVQEFQLYAKKLKINVNVKDKYGHTGAEYIHAFECH